MAILFMCFCFFNMTTAIAQAPTIYTSVDKNAILIGQQINYKVEASMPAHSFKVTWFTIPEKFDNFETITKNKIDTTIVNGTLTLSQTIVVTNFDSGRRVIPRMPVTFQPVSSTKNFKMFTDSIAIEVGYSPLDSIEPFHDIKPIIEIKPDSRPWWHWALLALAILLAGILVYFLVKHFNKRKEEVIFSSNLSPIEEAMRALEELNKGKLIENKNEKEFYAGLTDILKRFLSRRTNSFKMYLTTGETLMELPEYGIEKQQISNFANCLRMGDAVKYAKYIPPVSENQECWQLTKNLITNINNFMDKNMEGGT